MRTIITTKTAFTFDELSDSAKEIARNWFREASAGDEWWDATYSDAMECAARMGIEIDCQLNHANSPKIYFSGFASQGDGACFEGRYSFGPNGPKEIRAYAPQDTDLHRIADELAALGAGWTADIAHRGHYNHSGCMAIVVDYAEELPQAEFSKGEETVIQALRNFADYIYKQLEKEDEYRNADEQVDENIRANEYEFDESGRIA